MVKTSEALIMQLPTGNESREPPIPLPGAHLTDVEGRHAQIASIHAAGQEINAVIRLERGGEVVLPVSVLELQPDGTYCLPFALDRQPAPNDPRTVIPVIEEQLAVGKRIVDTGKGVRIHKTVSEQEQVIDLPLMRDEVQVERVPVGEKVDAAALPAPHYDGDTLVVPVFEEVLVVEKQVRLKEEIRITRKQHEIHAPQTVVVRSEQVAVEHFDEHVHPRDRPDG